MSTKGYLKSHRQWQDGVGLLLGMVIGLSPWLAREFSTPSVVLNASLSGLAILMLAQLEMVHLRRWEEALEALLGLWVMASPTVFGFDDADHLRFYHWILGGITAAIGVLGLWQDWGKSKPDLDDYSK